MDNRVILLVLVLVALAIWAWRISDKHRRRARMFAEGRSFVADVERAHALPVVNTNVILQGSEAAFYSAPSVLYETQPVRHYQAGHVGLRVAKGVFVGATSGRSAGTREWRKIGTGCLTVTNKRLIFDGLDEDRTAPLDKLVSVEPGLDVIVVSVEGRQHGMIFESPNPLILTVIIRICIQTKDPRDLSKIDLDVKLIE